MDFTFTEEQELFRKTVREFCEKEITPRVREMDTKGEIPQEIIKGMARLNLLGMTVSPEYGGAGADFTLASIAAEELGRADISVAIPVLFLVEAAWGYIFDKYGTEQAKDEILPRVTKGETFIGIAVTEPAGGSDILGAGKTMMKKEGGNCVLNGEKIYISGVKEVQKNGGGHLTLAKTEPKLEHRGMTFCFVPLKDTPGVTTTLFEDMGRMGISTGGFTMDNVKLPEHYIVGEMNRGFYYAMEGFSCARVLIGATCVGAAEGAIEYGIEYIKQRKAFGRPIGKFEGIQFELADNATRLEASRLLCYKAAWTMDKMYQEKRFTHHDVSKMAAMTKLEAPLMAFEVINDVMSWVGAFAYTKECTLEMGLRGIRSYSIGAEGTQNIMRLIIARELLGREFLPYR
ncbi:MAG: acyl-CoA dehydrogenase family protein [Candidatus Hodarchaeota archaeon]